MTPAENQRGITFHWELLRRFPVVLPGFILLSLLIHAATFFLFRVVYPPQATMSAPPPAITVLDPQRPDHQALLRWVEAEDPAPVSSVSNDVTERLLQVTYLPSYATLRTPPLKLPESSPPVPFPPARDPISIIRSADPKIVIPRKAAPGNPTRVTISGQLGPRVSGELPRMVFRSQSSNPLETATFLIGVDQQGVVQYVLPQASSGNPAMDELASDYLNKLKVAPGETAITWGTAAVEWGPDAYSNTRQAP